METTKIIERMQRQVSPKEIIPRPNILIKTAVSSFMGEKKEENYEQGEYARKLEGQIENSLKDVKKLNYVNVIEKKRKKRKPFFFMINKFI